MPNWNLWQNIISKKVQSNVIDHWPLTFDEINLCLFAIIEVHVYVYIKNWYLTYISQYFNWKLEYTFWERSSGKQTGYLHDSVYFTGMWWRIWILLPSTQWNFDMKEISHVGFVQDCGRSTNIWLWKFGIYTYTLRFYGLLRVAL